MGILGGAYFRLFRAEFAQRRLQEFLEGGGGAVLTFFGKGSMNLCVFTATGLFPKARRVSLAKFHAGKLWVQKVGQKREKNRLFFARGCSKNRFFQAPLKHF